jgi:hypothetical protein
MRTPLRSRWHRWWHLRSRLAAVETHVATLQAALEAQGSIGVTLEQAGSRVVILSHLAGGQCRILEVDIPTPAELERLTRELTARYGTHAVVSIPRAQPGQVS